MFARRLLLALVLLAAGAPPVLAGPSPATVEGELADDGWVGLSLEATGGSGHLAVDVSGSMPVSVGFLLLDGHQHPWGPAVFVIDDRHGERVQLQEGPVDVDVDRRHRGSLLLLHAGLSWSGFADDVTVVTWVGGDVAEANYTVAGGEEASLLDRSEGTGSFLLLDTDLGSGLEWWNPPVGARATLAEETRAIERSLVGIFDHGDDALDAMSATMPDGTQACPCGFAGSSAGGYTFQAVGAGAGPNASVVLAGADVRLPAPAR